jgi:putative aldouronate transport system permease protein
MCLVVIVTLYPFLYLIAQSFSSEAAVYSGSVTILPVGFNTRTYEVVLANKDFYTSYKNTFIYVISGTLVSLCMSSILAYPLSKAKLRGHGILTKFVIFTMFFAGGLIPNYVLINSLGMRNSIWAIIIPGAINTYYVLIMRSFFVSIPDELEEAAAIDGMSTYGIFLKIVLPLSKPIIATMVLFYAVDMWNNWFAPFIYLDNKNLQPVTLYLRGIVEGATSATEVGAAYEEVSQISANIRSCAMVLTALPIMCVYPFVQKYFVQGMMIGSVKG